MNLHQSRRERHDLEQARRRTVEQNRALIALVRAEDSRGGDIWGYDNLPEGGGPLTVTRPSTRQTWTIDPMGQVQERG